MPDSVPADRFEVLISAERIERRLDELARDIARDLSGRELALVGVLRASFIFMADLVRRLDLPLQLDFLSAASYGDATSPQHPVVVRWGPVLSVRGRDVLLVDAVLDTGRTLAAARAHLLELGARSVATCVLVVKEGAQEVDVPVDYQGFTVPNRFLVGYGLDRAQRHRNLPYIAALAG